MAFSFGDTNVGFQTGTIHGPVTHTFPERPETPPQPSIVIPFARDADFVNRGTLVDELRERCALPNARIALVGLGGVGKSQIAIEHAYAARDRSSQTWVLWAHASNAARLEQSFRDIADRVKMAGRQDPHANIFKLVHDWLCDSKEQWLLVLDNLDDADFLLELQGAGSKAGDRPLREYLPHCERGSMLITTRNRGAALKLVDQHDIIALDPMSEAQAQTLLGKKLGVHATQHDNGAIAELAAVLEYIPLAMVQAAAYISQRAPLFSVAQYLNQFKKSERKQTSLLNYNVSQLRRDREASNSIITTWQISFEHIQRTQPSAADLLSLMSFFDRQAIPKSVLQIRAEHEEGEVSREDDEAEADCSEINQLQSERRDGEFEDNYKDDFHNDSANDSDSDSFEGDAFQNNIATLLNFSFVSVSTDGTAFEMHALVQLSIHMWLIANGRLERSRREFISKLCAAFRAGHYENWAECQKLFAQRQRLQQHGQVETWNKASSRTIAAESHGGQHEHTSLLNEQVVLCNTYQSTSPSTFNLRSATDFTVPESRINEREESIFEKAIDCTQDDDMHDTFSTGSLETSPGDREGKVHLAHFLAADEDLRPLYISAMQKTGKTMLASTLPSLLEELYQGLLFESKTERERVVISLLRSERGRSRMGEMIVNIVDSAVPGSVDLAMSNAESDDAKERAKSVEQTETRAKFVHAWFASGTPVSEELPQKDQTIDDNTPGIPEAHDEDLLIEDTIHQELAELEGALRTSVAFRRLKRALKILSLPQELRDLVESVSKGHIEIRAQQKQSYTNRVKAWIEDYTQLHWDWWPLEARMRDLKGNEKRVVWRCTCGTRLWKEVACEDAELLKTILPELSDHPRRPYRCKTRIDLNTSCKRLAMIIMSTVFASSAKQRYTPDATIGPSSSTTPGSQTSSTGQTNASSLSQPQQQKGPSIAFQPPGVATTQGSDQSPTWILFGVKGLRRRLEVTHVEIDACTDDSRLYRSLKSAHEATRGRFKLWFSPWKFEYCEVVRFKKVAPRWIFGEGKEMPPAGYHSDYDFSPQPPAETANPPVTPHEFAAQLNACVDPCRWFLPHDCMLPFVSHATLKKVPKKKTKYDTSSRDATNPVAWGLEAKYTVKAVYVVFYYVLILALPFAFLDWWLDKHPGDLQNAAVPITIVIALFSSIWGIYAATKVLINTA